MISKCASLWKNKAVQDFTQFWYVYTNDLVGCCVGFYLTWYETSGSLTFDREDFLL